MDRRKKSALRYTKEQENSLTAQPSPPPSSVTALSEWYRSINTLPLSRFIDIAVDNNILALVKTGIPDAKDLADAWENIKSEYAEAVGDHEQVAYLKALKEISILQITLQQIHLLIDTLKQIYYKPFADRLNKFLSTSFDFENCNRAAYDKLLQACYNRSRAFKIDLDLKLIYFKSIEEKNQGDGTAYTREYFLSILIIISNHAKYQIMDDVTVFEFCKRLKMYSDYCKEMEKHYKK
jgi:hypothetical protein